MTQQPYAPQPGYPPQQGYPQQPPANYPPQYPQAPQPTYPPAPQNPYAQPGYPPQGYGQPPAPAGPPPVAGTLDAFYTQPSAGSGPGIGWTDAAKQPRPLGTTWVGVVVRDVTDADTSQVTDIRTQQPVFHRDGRPKLQLKVPLKQVMLFNDPHLQQPLPLPAEMAEGEGTWYVKGAVRDELVRAMSESGVSGAPKAGATVVITLVNRRNIGGGLNPANVVQVRYIPAASGEGNSQGTPAQPATQPTPVQQAPQQVQQPAPQAPPFAAEQYATYAGQPQGQVQGQPQAPVQQAPVQQAPASQYAPPQAQQPAPQQQPQGQPPQFDAEQAALFAKITGQPAPQQVQQQGQPAA